MSTTDERVALAQGVRATLEHLDKTSDLPWNDAASSEEH